ncbi:DUF4307 domain-containing protein [Streptomyces carpaticus]|uniref:DUF4307 domain-containing protein n=1 Tax=Streptomyces carpaticus TaxID=285558 RepID=UPI002200290E|nr:DUF4307 domain-containing protein [Streptomyces carpaticus]
MATVRDGVPEGRYGRSGAASDARTDRRLKITGLVLGVLLLAFVGWAGVHYISGQKVTGEVTGFTVTSDTEVSVNIAVRKPASATGVCTVRSQAADGLEVGRAEFRFEEDGDALHRTVVLKTTERATSAELMGCAEG